MRRGLTAVLLGACLSCALKGAALESEVEFLSVKTPRANVRKGPDLRAERLWVMWHLAPVIALSYRGDWVHVKDFEGDEGWIRKDLLSEDPTVAVAVKQGKVRKNPTKKSKVLWILDKGYSLRLFSAQGEWYEVSDLQDVSGWIHQASVWGAPPPPPSSQAERELDSRNQPKKHGKKKKS